MIAVLAEKPSVARAIASVIGANENHSKEGYITGNGYIVTWAFGHLIGLAQPHEYGFKNFERASLPMLPDKFKLIPRQIKAEKGYKDDESALKQLNIIKGIFEQAESIIVATDAGREGELIFRYIYNFLNCKKPFNRLWISSLTERGIKEGFNKLQSGSQYDNLYFAAKGRSESDWLIGMNASQALSLAAGQGVFSLGRVQTPTLAMICNRYLGNKNFTPNKYWRLRLAAKKYDVQFSTLSDLKWDKKEDAESYLQKIKADGKIKILSVEKKEKAVEPPLLFDLTGLQKEANSKFGFSADKTLAIAQALYENKLVSYPRTGSKFVPDDVFSEIPQLIRNLEQYPHFSQIAAAMRGKTLNKKSVDATKVTDHHALLITEIHTPPFMAEDETRIYNLIAGRMLEAFSDKCIKEMTTTILESASVKFTLKNSLIKKSGWKAVFNDKDKDESEDVTDNEILPVLDEGEILELSQIENLEKQTAPLPVHNEATLLGAMETAGKDLENESERAALKEIGLGTPATRAGIIEVLLYRQYIKRDKKNLIPTDKGLAVFEIVKNMKIADVSLTAAWENALSEIENGNMNADTFRKGIEILTAQITDELLNAKIRIPSDMPTCVCPKCKENKMLFFPKVVKCSSPDCGLIIFRNKGGKLISDKQIIELLEKGKTGVIKDFKNKDGKSFDAALKLDEVFNVSFEYQKKEPQKNKR